MSGPLSRKTEAFFRNELVPDSGKAPVYDLNTEFAKTRKNRNRTVVIAVLVFVAALAVTTLLVTGFMQDQAKVVSFDIKDFKDINLTEVLSAARKDVNRLQNARAELAELKRLQNAEIARIRERYIAERAIVENRILALDARTQALAALSGKESQEIRAVTASYSGRIAAKETEIAGLEKDAAASGELAQGTKGNPLLESVDRLLELEKKTLRDTYEARIAAMEREHQRALLEQRETHRRLAESLVARYNPVFQEKEALAVLAAPSPAGVSTEAPAFPAILEHEGILTRSDYAGIVARFRGAAILLDRLQAIPYLNSVAPALLRSDALVDSARSGALGALQETAAVLRLYREAILAHLDTTREHGYVIDARNPERLRLVLATHVRVADKASGIVIRGERDKIATIEISQEGASTFARVLDGGRIAPFDKVLIQLR